MFIRKRKNRSGSTSIVVISRRHGQFVEVRKFGTAESEEDVSRPYVQATRSLSMVMINLGNVITYLTILSLVGINPSPMCLAHLLVSWYVIQSSILAECGSCLLEMKWHISLDALFTDV